MRRTQRGGTMVFVLFAMTLLLVASLGAAALSVGSLYRSRSDMNNSIAFNACQAALELGMSKTMKDLTANNGTFTKTSGDVSADLQDIAPGCTASWEVIPNTGDSMYAYITASVTYGTRTKSIRGTIYARDFGIWNNAIFAGAGASGQSINGNVDIRGSVHILGDGEPYTDTNGDGTWTAAEAFTDKNKNGVWDPGEAFTDKNGDGVWTAAEPFNDLNKNGEYDEPIMATDLNSDLSGSAKIANHYGGMPSDLAALIPAAPKKNGVETLSGEVRVKHGKLGLSGTATVGQSGTVDGGTRKATIDGVYVNDGYGGNKGSSNVYSDNGTSNSYDLDSLGITMPILSGLGAKEYKDSSGVTWKDQETYLNTKSLSITVEEITAATSSFTFGPDANGNSITFVKGSGSTPSILTINGIIKVPSSFQLGNKDTIRFAGNGTFWCPGTIEIDGNFLPVDGLSFPSTARAGFIAKDSIKIADGSGSSQLKLVGAFYAQNRIKSSKQNQIGGTFVSSYFDMGSNVPNIYQVPTLAKNLPPGMPGHESIISLKLRGWRQRK